MYSRDSDDCNSQPNKRDMAALAHHIDYCKKQVSQAMISRL